MVHWVSRTFFVSKQPVVGHHLLNLPRNGKKYHIEHLLLHKVTPRFLCLLICKQPFECEARRENRYKAVKVSDVYYTIINKVTSLLNRTLT